MRRSILSAMIASATVFVSGSGADAEPNGGVSAQVAALQAAVASLTSQVTALQSAVTALQGTTGAAQVWQNATGVVTVPRNDDTFVTNWTFGTMASLSLPAGSYLMLAKTWVLDPVVTASGFFCFIGRSGSSSFVDSASDYSVQDEPTVINLQGVVTLAGPETLTLKCGVTGPADTVGDPAQGVTSRLVAIKASPQ